MWNQTWLHHFVPQLYHKTVQGMSSLNGHWVNRNGCKLCKILMQRCLLSVLKIIGWVAFQRWTNLYYLHLYNLKHNCYRTYPYMEVVGCVQFYWTRGYFLKAKGKVWYLAFKHIKNVQSEVSFIIVSCLDGQFGLKVCKVCRCICNCLYSSYCE